MLEREPLGAAVVSWLPVAGSASSVSDMLTEYLQRTLVGCTLDHTLKFLI
jgi:hypothetical protein